MKLIWRCRSCYHKAKRGCPMCVYWRSKEKFEIVRLAPALQCECGFVSNVPELAAAHDADHCAAHPPFVCPGCHVVGEEPCRPGCIDAAIAADNERRAEDRDMYGDDLEDES